MWRCKKWSIQSWNVESRLMEVINQLFIYAYLHNINLPGTKIGQTFYVDQSTQFLIEYLKLIYYWAALSDWLLCWTRCPTSSNIGPSKFMYPEKNAAWHWWIHQFDFNHVARSKYLFESIWLFDKTQRDNCVRRNLWKKHVRNPSNWNDEITKCSTTANSWPWLLKNMLLDCKSFVTM